MPDYTSILRRSISALPDSSPEVREAVYQRARAALARQLTAVDPPLTTREIERQHHELEEAVARLEAELAPQPSQAYEGPEAQDALPSVTPATVAATAIAAAPARALAPRAEPVAPARDDLDVADRDVDEDDEYEDEYEDEDRGSRLPLVAGLIALVVLIGGAAYGFVQRDALMSFLGISEGDRIETAQAPDAAEPPAVAEPPVQTAEQPPAEGIGKRPDRLTNGDEPPAAETALLAPPEAPPTAEGPLSEEPADQAPPDAPAPVSPPVGEPPAAAAPPPPAASPQEQQTASVEQPGQSIVAQRAIYYYQGAAGSPGQATNGTVTWAQITKDNAPAVQARLELAERNVSAIVTISRNTDSTLPASHLVEIQFTGEFGPTPIQRVPALVMKQTEQARGEPLNGAAVPVTEELFWIALADNEEQITRNLQLLREGSWFDIPILFNDGTRALLTFEKGIPGDRVFETVMSSWTPS